MNPELLEHKMQVAQDTKKHISYNKSEGYWYWCDRDEQDNPDAQHGPHNTFLEALEDAVAPYYSDEVEWSQEDQMWAYSMGWSIFSLDTGYMQIQALDDPEEVCAEYEIESLNAFDGSMRDFEAVAWVYQHAINGEKADLCQRAIALIERNNMEGFGATGPLPMPKVIGEGGNTPSHWQ